MSSRSTSRRLLSTPKLDCAALSAVGDRALKNMTPVEAATVANLLTRHAAEQLPSLIEAWTERLGSVRAQSRLYEIAIRFTSEGGIHLFGLGTSGKDLLDCMVHTIRKAPRTHTTVYVRKTTGGEMVCEEITYTLPSVDAGRIGERLPLREHEGATQPVSTTDDVDENPKSIVAVLVVEAAKRQLAGKREGRILGSICRAMKDGHTITAEQIAKRTRLSPGRVSQCFEKIELALRKAGVELGLPAPASPGRVLAWYLRRDQEMRQAS